MARVADADDELLGRGFCHIFQQAFDREFLARDSRSFVPV
jgi:hypothetical protein